MFQSVFRGPHGAPAYVEGEWVFTSDERKSVTSVVPMECVESETTTCPVERCTASGVAEPSQYCSAFHNTCYIVALSAVPDHMHPFVSVCM